MGWTVFQHVFDKMNDMLDEIVKQYPSSQGMKKQELLHKWKLLRQMSDLCVDEWVLFEEKMNIVRSQMDMSVWQPSDKLPELQLDAFIRGQGYFKLQMFSDAIRLFLKVIEVYPQSILGGLYLGMSFLHAEQLVKSDAHLRCVLGFTQDALIKAMIYNALGCIKAKQGNKKAALCLFDLALRHDPTFVEPLHNMEACRINGHQLHYGDQLATFM